MSLNRAQFEALVEHMEKLARERPLAYRLRLIGLAALGYGYLGIVVVALGCVAGGALYAVAHLRMAALYLFFGSGALFIVLVRALWIRLKKPEGVAVTRGQVPELFELIDGLQKALVAPVLHEVLITGDFNAGVLQWPRLGIFGWHHNYLLLGLPLLKSLNEQQLRAVIAHELGHLSHGHGRRMNWIYRLRLTWGRVQAALGTHPSFSRLVIQQFCSWYVPYFNACSFPLARANEYEADAASVNLTDRHSAAQALTAVNVIGRLLSEQYWPSILAGAREMPQPGFAPYSGFHLGLITETPRDKLDSWLASAMSAITNCNDTHPALRDRLAAISAPPELSLPTEGSSCERLLGAQAKSIEQALDEKWSKKVAPSWKTHYEQAQKKKARLAALKALTQTPTLEQELELAQLEEEVGEGAEVALELRRSLRARYPESIAARFALGRQLFQRKDSGGISLLESVGDAQPQFAAAAAQLLRDHYWSGGQKELADHWHACWTKAMAVLQAAQWERTRLSARDALLSHGLPLPKTAELRLQLSALPRLRRAYLARKEVRYLPEQPLYVLAFAARGALWGGGGTQTKKLLEEMKQQIAWPGAMLIVPLGGRGNAWLKRRMRRIEGAQIL